MGNPWKYRTRARAQWSDDEPKMMDAKRAGTCEWCGKPFPAGTPIAYSLGKCWHANCHPRRNEPRPGTELAPEPQPQAKPPTDTGIYKVSYTGAAVISGYTDSVIRDAKGNALFVSFLGSDSIVKALGAGFVEGKSRDAIYFDSPKSRWSVKIRRHPDAAYKRRATKLARGAQEICCAEGFLPMPLQQLEKNFKMLLVAPGQDPAEVTYRYLARVVPTPTLDVWTPEIWRELQNNWSIYEGMKEESAFARAKYVEPEAGAYSMIALRVTEDAYDTLISRLVQSGRVEF